MNAVQKTNEHFSLPVTKAEFSVMRTACGFEDVLSQPDAREQLKKLVDARLGDDYPIDSVLKLSQLAMACTQENPHLRPNMRYIVVALMTLSSSTVNGISTPYMPTNLCLISYLEVFGRLLLFWFDIW